MSALQGFILLRDESMGTWLLHCLMTFVVLVRMRGEVLVSQILLIPEFLRAHPAFIILPLESLCEPLSPCVSFTLQPMASAGSCGGTGPLLGPRQEAAACGLSWLDSVFPHEASYSVAGAHIVVIIAEKNLNYKTTLIFLQLTSKEHELK